jgi:hypothetical protein
MLSEDGELAKRRKTLIKGVKLCFAPF